MVLYLRGPVNWCANQLLKPPSQGTSTHYLCYMIQKDIELERAKALDGAFKIIDKHYPKDLSSDPVYLKYHLQEKLKIENFLLLKYLKEESKVFQITKESSQGSETEADVSLFPEALHKLRQDGPWFESDLLFRREQKRMYAHSSRQRNEEIARERVAEKMQEDREKNERNKLERERLEREQRAEEREIAREKREVTLVKEVADSRASEGRVRRWNLWLAIATVISSSVAAYGALKDKLFDTKEVRLQDQITNLNSKIETNQGEHNKLLQQWNAIPDSIKQLYIK